jgi:hypothetical protein
MTDVPTLRNAAFSLTFILLLLGLFTAPAISQTAKQTAPAPASTAPKTPPPKTGVQLKFKLSTSLHFGNYGDLNGAIVDWTEFKKKETLGAADGIFQIASMKDLHTGIDFDGEILVLFNPRFALGLGAAIIYTDLAEENSMVEVQKSGSDMYFIHPTKAAAYPLYLSAHYFFPIGKKMTLFVKGGTGMIWGKYSHREGSRSVASTNTNFAYSLIQIASSHALFTLGGIGLSYQFDPKMELFLEVGGRLAKLSDFSGNLRPDLMGTLYYYQEYNAGLDFWQTKVRLFETEPAGEDIRAVRKATVDFSGITLKFGLIMKF